ncbi:MAG: glutamate racemase [Treponema sp.]|nr:glutamate racemase [Treponema sp.]
MVDFAFLDSGTGGLPYLLRLKEMEPSAECVYVGDTANFPYGTKSHEEIVSCVLSICERIVNKFNPRCIVIACNTMSVNTLDEVRRAYPDIQIVGTVPAIKLASSVSKKRKIGLLATVATVQSDYTKQLKEKYAEDCDLVLREDTELIDFIERKSFTSSQTECEEACRPAAEFFRKEGCDAVILGCTHFLNIADTIQKVCGDEIKVVDSRDGVARRALDVCHISKDEKKEYNPVTKLYVTGEKDTEEYEIICERYGIAFSSW